MADKDNKSKLTYHVWDKDNNEYDIPDEVVQQRGMDNFAKDFEGGYITMFDDKKQKVDVPIEDVGEYRKQGYMWYDTSGNATPINEVGKKPSPSKEKEQSQYPQEVKRVELKKPGLISQALGMMPKVDAGNIGREQKVGGMIANLLLGDNMQVQQPAQKDASPESKEAAPVTTPTGVVNNEGLMDAKLANYIENRKQRPDKQSSYFENMVADLLADGTANSNEEAVNMVLPALYRYANRSAMDVTNQVVSSLPDDTVQDAEQSIGAQWYSHGVQDKLKQEADSMGISYDDYVANHLKPAMVQSLVNKYGPNYRNIAEGIATRLYSHEEHVQERLMNQDINDALSSVINKYVSPSVVDEYNKAQEAGSKAFSEGMEGSQFIPANLRLGTALGAQYEANEAKDPAKVLSRLQQKFGKLYRNPKFLNDMSNAAFKVMQRYGLNGTQSSDPKQFKPMINAAIKNELDQLEIKGMMPKGSAEYIMKTGLGNTIVGKIIRKAVQTDYQNWLEDIANQQYQPGFWENVASGALTFAGDAWSYWLPGAAGGKLTKSMVAKAEGKLAGDLMSKGMERKMAERAAKVLIGKSKAEALKSGAVHGAVTFGGQSAISKPIDEVYRTGQFDENGMIYNPSVGKVIANTLGEVAKQSAVGAIMQGGTIANMVGKGRGLATNILADVGGKVVDSGIMTGHQMLERMAQDPNFKPTGKDAAESFLESMANLTAIGLPGMVGKYARFKDAREFNKKFDFTDQDIAELKRFGYDGLRDAFEKVGIGEYAVVGENAQRLDGQLTQKYMDLMNDKSVPEVLKAKMMAVVEGKRPSSFSPIVDSIIVQPMDHDGKVYLETLNKDGGIIDRKEFSSLDEAQKADKKMEYEKTLGLASVLEGEFHNEFTQEHLEGLYNKAAQKYNMGEKLTDEDKAAVYLHQNAGAIKDIMDKQQKGIILTDEEQKQINAYRHYYDSALENSSVMRKFVNTFEDSHGVARGTLRNALESKDKKYSPLVESYLKELYNSIELKREMKQTMDDLYNTSHGNEQKRIEQGGVEGEKPTAPVEGSAGGQEPPVSEGPSPYQGNTDVSSGQGKGVSTANSDNSSADVITSDAFVMGQNAYKNGDSEALQAIDYNSDLATGRLQRAFADNEKMPDIVANAYNEGRDMEQFVAQRASSLTPAQKEAISKYVEAMDAKKGAIDALQHADDGYGEALKEQLWSYQTVDGNIVPATLDSGKQVFLKKANEYGGAFVVVPDEQGLPMIKQVSNAEIKEVGAPVSLDEYIENAVAQQKDARAQQFISQFDGSGLKPNDQVTVAMEEGDANIDMTFAGYSEDGKIVLTDGKDYLPLSKEEFAAWHKNALDNTINEHLDAEDAQRANDDAAKAEADKKQRYANGIVGLSEGQPDYSSKNTDPNVAAEYLQEQFGEDHGKLLNLVNGSRDDIETQLANKKKAAAEYQDWLDTNADLDPEKAKKVEDELSLVNEQIADLDARFKNWNTIRNSVMTPDELRTMKEERKAEIERAGIDKSSVLPDVDTGVRIPENSELKDKYPTQEAASGYITSERRRVYKMQEETQREIDGVDKILNQYMDGDMELSAEQLRDLNTTKAELANRQNALTADAKALKEKAESLNILYIKERAEQNKKNLEALSPKDRRKELVAKALEEEDMKAIKEIYKDASTDVMDLAPRTLEEFVSERLFPHSLNAESLAQELGSFNFRRGIGSKYDTNKFNYLLAKKGEGLTINELAKRVWEDLSSTMESGDGDGLQSMYTDQDVRNAILDMFKTYDSVREMRNVTLLNRIAAAENELSGEEEWYEQQKEREIFEKQKEIDEYKSYIHDKELSLPSESELDHINGLELDRMMEIEDREREYKQYVKSILPELADYDDRSNEEGYGGGSSLGSDSSRRGVDEENSQGEEVGNGEASSESEIGEGSDSGRKGRQETGSMEPGEGSAVRGSHLPQAASFGERLKSAIAETETEPTEAQKKAGNYKKGHLSFGGYDYTVETPKGVTRSGKDEQGKPWSVTMHDTYGYILGKIGVDGDHIDMFINDAADLDTFDGNVYVVDQVNPETGEFDEHKVMYGYPSEEAATEAYLANYSKGWKGLGKVTSVPKATFDKWLESSDRKTKPFADYAMVQKEQAKFDRDVKEVEPSEMTEVQKVAYDAVSTMLKKAGIPVKVVSNEDMEKVAEAQGKGVVYGYTDGKEIVLNQEHLNPNTPIHEYQHLWRTAAKNMNPELIEHGDKLIMQTQLFADLKQDPNYNHLTDEQICDEAFARLTGEDGAAILEQMAKDAIKENPLDTAKELSVINKLKEWLKKFWYWTLDTFTKWKPEDIKKMTLEDIRNLVLRDLANGVDPRTKLHEAENADDIKFMGSTTKKRMKNIASQFEGRKLDEAQQVVADVYSGKDNNRDFSFTNGGSERTMVMRQGNDDHAGTKHSVYRHFGVSKNYITIDDILSLPKILNVSTRKPSKKGTIEYSYTDKESGVTYTVVTKPVGNKEHFQNFYSDRKANPSDASHVAEGNTYTPEGARKTDGNTFMAAKVDNNSETAKGNGGNLSVEDKIKAVSQQFGVDEADVAMYANAVKKGSTAEAARARANIKRHLLQENEDKISSLKELLKYTVPVNNALKENFGDLDAMIEERVKQVEAQRNAMEAARKRAEEEEAKRQKHLEELSVIPDDQLDKQYMDALAKGDDATAREMLDEAARRKGYDDTESAYQGVGAWAAPGNPGYESDKARRDDWESSGSDVNLEDMALGYTPQPDDYFSHHERYSQNTPHGLESVKAINTAIDAIKNGEKDVKVKVYRAVPTSVKEGKLRNGDWVTPSKKYAEMHGTNRLEGKYRIIEDEVPTTQLWWDGNDANEFGFDDGKAYKYKNAKNNRKLNDLVTYDDEGDVIPPSKRFNSRKSDIRFMFAGEKGAAEADKADEQTIRMDNLDVAKQMEDEKKDAKIIKMATGWEKGVDGKWRYEMPDAKIKDTIDVGGGNIFKRFEEDMLWTDGKLEDAVDAPKLFEAYPQLKNIKIHTDAVMNDMPSNGEYNPQTKTITIHADELKYLNSILNHEIQHVIQREEGFAHGGTPEQVERDFNAAKAEWKARSYAFELEEKAKEMGGEYNQSEVEKALIQEYKDMDMPEFIPDKETRIKGFNYFARGYADRSMDDAIKRFRLDRFQRTDFDSYQEYRKLAGEVEARNVEKRLGMTDEERRNSLASVTEDVNRDEQIVMNGSNASYSIVKDPETIKKLDKEDTVKVYRAMQVGEDGKLYPPMAAKVKGKFVEPIELGKWEQADERPELADDKGMFTLNKGNGKSLKAAYNPYLHTSRTPLNDQFSEAQNRPNIVTVEVEVPKSELTSGYKADKAKDAVGEVEWKAGIIQGQLTGKRKVVLSRWDKPVRIVPDSEVADVIVNDMFKGKNITMPSNVVTPSLRKELEKRGVPFVETDNRGRIVGGENDGVHYSKVYGKKANLTAKSYYKTKKRVDQRVMEIKNSLLPTPEASSGSPLSDGKGINFFSIEQEKTAENERKIADSVVNTANKLGGAEATVYSSLDDVPEEYRSEIEQGAKGWYDPETHSVHVYLPNCEDGNDAQRTVFHEKIGHEGMEVLLGGEDGVRKFANFVYRSVGKDVRGKIIDFANKYDPDWKNPDRMNVGTQEYIAHLAEEGPKTADDFSLWTKIKHYLIKVLKKLGVRVPGLLNDKDLRYYLMKAGKALHVWDNMPKEKQEAMMKQASNAEIKDALSNGPGKGKPQPKKGESTIQYMKRVQEWRKWQNAREDENDPEPPMFYDFDKDEAGKKEWAQLNKDWRDSHHLVGEEPMGMPIRMEGEEDGAYMTRIHEYEKWKEAMKDQEDPMPDMFAFEKKKQEEVKRKYEDWLAKHDLLEQQQADLDLYEGKIYPAETNPKADALEQQVMQDLAEVTSTDVSKEGAAKTVKHAVIHRRKNMEEASADDAIYINDVKNRIEKMADSGAFDKLLSDYKGMPNRAEKLAEAIPYIIEAPRRLRDLAHDLNATGAFEKGHIHIQPTDVEAIQPFVADLIAETAKMHTVLKDDKEVKVYDDPQAVSEVANKLAQAINANHQGEEDFVPIDGTDILSKHVLPLVKQQIVPVGIDYKNLSPEMKAAIDSIRDWYNYTYDWLKDNHTLREDTGYNADYVNHIWDKEKSDPEAYATFVENRQRTKSPNEKPRTISTLMEGISVGLVPKTTDITKMMAYYSRSNIEAWVNKTMLQELSGLNVIERNEDGEIVSSDALLSSTPPFNLEQYKYFEIPGVGPVWVYNVSPKQVKVKNPITGKERVLYSEASAGDRFGVVFESYQSSPFWKAFDTLASSAKKLELGFSGFHAGALTEVYMVQNMVEFGPKKAMANFMKYIFVDTMKNHQLPCFANPEDFQEAATHLVKFGATNDYAAADVQNMFDNMRDAMMKVQEKLKDGNKISGTVALATMPLKVATQMLSLINKGMDRALWDFLHDGLKLATYRMRADKTKERAKKKGWTEEELSRALDEDGQFVNDMFGGQHWDILGASHRTLRYAGRVLLSPDWNASTTRHFLALTGFCSIWNEATFENFKQYYQRLKHKELMPKDEGRRSRQISALLCYGIGFMVFYEGIANGINAAFRALDEEKERKKAEEIRKTNPSYKSMYELAYGDEGMKWYDYLMRGNSLGQQSKIFMGRYEDGTEMYIRHGKQFREVPEYLFNHKGELEFPGPMVQRMIGKANPMVRMTLDNINYLSDFQSSHADQEIQRKYGKTIGLLYKDALYWAPFLIPSQENKEFKAVDFFFPSSKGFSPWKAQSYFKDFILSGDMEGVVMTYQSCQRNGIDPEAQIKAAIGSVKALESAEMKDGITSLQVASERFDEAKSITEKKKMRQKMKKFLSQSEYKAFTQKEALDMVQGYLNGDDDLKEMEKAESKYLMKAKAEDVTEDWRIQNVWNGTMETYQEYQRLKDVDKAKANAFKNSKTNKRLFAARKAISAARRKMNKAKKQMDGTNDAAKLVEIRNTRKELLNTLNGME